MLKMICRLCLNGGKLIDVFDSRLTNSEQLRKCVLLGTGVEICPDDLVPKYICQNCSDIAIFLFKYRKKALANDRALKKLANQHVAEPQSETKDIVQFNRTVSDELMKDEDVFSKPQLSCKLESCKKTLAAKLAVHPTVIELIKTYPKLKIPNNLLKCQIQPTVILNRKEVEDWTPSSQEEFTARIEPITDIERFQLMCPGISIMKIKEPLPEIPVIEVSNVNNILNKRKLSQSPPNSLKKKRTDSCSSTNSEQKASEPKARTHRKRSSQTIEASSNKQLPLLTIITPPNLQDLPTVASIAENAQVERNSPAIPEQAQFSISEVPESIEQYSEDVEIIPTKRHRKILRVLSTDSENSNHESFNNDLDDSLLDTVDEEIVMTCQICNKMFNTRQQLSNHERVHRCCVICKRIFRSADALWCHQQDICFKTVTTNLPDLQLTRVDEQPDIVNRYPEAFLNLTMPNENNKATTNDENILCISDDDDDDVTVVNVSATDTAKVGVDVTSNQEFQHICRVFRKYKCIKLPLMKHKGTETKPRIYVKYNQKNQIVLENMYPELLTYRVPIDLVEKTTSFAYISFSKKHPQKHDIYCWANEPVIGLSQKTLMSVVLNPQIAATTTQCPNTTNILLSHLQPPNQPTVVSSVGQFSISNVPPLAFPLTPSPIVHPRLAQVSTQSGTPPIQLATLSTNFVQNPPSNDNIHNSAATSEALPSTSGIKDANFGLRVKTLSELNNI